MTLGRLMIGVGNPNRGDDGVGYEVIRRLKAYDGIGWSLATSDGEPLRLMELWEGSDNVILIDSMITAVNPPGTIRRWNVTLKALPADGRYTSSHALGLSDAIELARALGKLPRNIEVIGIESASNDVSDDLSGPVSSAVDAVVKQLMMEFANA